MPSVSRLFSLLLLSLLSACGSDAFQASEVAARARYQAEYRRWLAADLDTIFKMLLSVQGEYWTPRPSAHTPLVEVPLPELIDPVLEVLLAKPDLLARLDLQRPKQLASSVDVRALIGDYHCREGDALGTYSIGNLEKYVAGPRVSCAALAQAFVVREGAKPEQSIGFSDWLFYLPQVEGCRWLYFGPATFCANTLKEWLSGSIVGAQSNWQRLDIGEDELVAEMRAQPQLTLIDGVRELVGLPKPGEQGSRGGWNSLDFPAGEQDGPRAAPLGDYSDSMKILGSVRPAPMLMPDKTHLQVRRTGVTLVRLWDGARFINVRLRPHDWARAIVLVKSKFSTQLFQFPAREGAMYLDEEHRAALRFKDWVDYQRAQIRVWRRQVDREGYRILPPNAAVLPAG